MRTIPILKDDYTKFMEIRKHRPQDTTAAETFNYILRVFEESPLRITEKNHPLNKHTLPGSPFLIVDADYHPPQRHAIAGSASSPLMDLDNIRVVTPARLAEELHDEKKRRDALRAANEAPTRNNVYQEEKNDT